MDKDFNMLIIKELMDKDFNRWTLIMHRYMEICLFLIKQILDKDMVGNKIQTLEDLDHKLVMHLHFPSQTSIIQTLEDLDQKLVMHIYFPSQTSIIQTLEDLDHKLVMHLYFPSQTSIIKIFKIFLKGISIFKMIEFHQVIKIKNFNKIQIEECQ